MTQRSREGISHEAFDERLAELIGELTPLGLLAIEGVYEPLSEYFNNEIIEALENERDEESVVQLLKDGVYDEADEIIDRIEMYERAGKYPELAADEFRCEISGVVSDIENSVRLDDGRLVLEYYATPDALEENESYPISDWQYEIANSDTRLGYADWLERKLTDNLTHEFLLNHAASQGDVDEYLALGGDSEEEA